MSESKQLLLDSSNNHIEIELQEKICDEIKQLLTINQIERGFLNFFVINFN